jgi:hypothetical protein
MVAIVVGLLTVGLLAPGDGPTADAARRRPRPRRVAAAAVAASASSLTEDMSGRMPRTAHNEITGDFLKKGYDQRMVVEEGNLNIYDAAFKGGGLLRSTPTDLHDFGDSLTPWENSFWNAVPLKYRLGSIALAWTPDGLYMAGRRSATATRGDHWLYRLPPDGSCAQKDCAYWAQALSEVGVGGMVLATALAVGKIGTKEVIAIGTNAVGVDGTGVAVGDAETGSRLGSWFYDFNRGAMAIVTALDWDDSGSGLLAFGTVSDAAYPVHAVKVSADGTRSNHTSYTVAPGADLGLPSALTQTALSVAVGHRADGSAVIAAGMNDGGVKLWDPAVSSSNLLAQVPGSGQWNTDAGVDAVTFTDRIDGTVGVPDLVAVSSRSNTAQALRYDGSTTLKPLAVAPNGSTATDVGGIRSWFPGYKAGVLEFWNLSSTDPKIQLDFATRPNPAYGCWFSQSFNGNPALPTDSVILDRNNPNGPNLAYTVATQTAGTGGGCAAADFTGQWAAYVVATPLDRPADRTVAKLVFDRSGNLTVKSVGGSLTLGVRGPSPDFHGPLGRHQIVISAPARAKLPDAASLKVTGTRLDPATNDRPVYRFDVSATTWQLPVSTPPRTQSALPPLRVYAATDTGPTVDLGRLVPQGQPSRATSGTVTLSPVSFYWQNPYDWHDPDPLHQAQNLRYIQLSVEDGPDHVVSNFIDLRTLTKPAVGTTISQVIVCPASGSSSCDTAADPVANGLDQAPLRIQLYDDNGVLGLDDAAYGQIYYRDQDGDLLTGLVPADGSPYVRVSPYAGAYANDNNIITTTSTRPPITGRVGGRYGYLSTTFTAKNQQKVTAHVGGSVITSDPFTVAGTSFNPQVTGQQASGNGFSLTGCSDYTGSTACRLAQAGAATATGSAPALYLTTDPDTGEPRIGVQFATIARTALGSLPLQQVAGQPEHTVAASPLTINNGGAHLNTTSGFQPADTIDTWLVTHGTQIAVRGLPVGGGN